MKHFEEEFLKVLNKHVLYVTKNLRKGIMKRSKLENKYISNFTVENMIKYKNT